MLMPVIAPSSLSTEALRGSDITTISRERSRRMGRTEKRSANSRGTKPQSARIHRRIGDIQVGNDANLFQGGNQVGFFDQAALQQQFAQMAQFLLLLFQSRFQVARGYFAALMENFAKSLASHPVPSR